MRYHYFMRSYILFFCGTFFTSLVVAEEESIVLDPETGNYTVVYESVYGKGLFQKIIFIPATKIDPRVQSSFKQKKDGMISYKYKIMNQRASKQAIDVVSILVSEIEQYSEEVPDNWGGGSAPEPPHTRVGWSYDGRDVGGIQPGHTLGNFGLVSTDLPGISKMQLHGATPVQGYPDEGPALESEVGKKLGALEVNDHVLRHVVVPRIAINDPFSASRVLTGIQRHLHELVILEVIDAAFSSRLSVLITSAIDSAKQGNLVVARNSIKEARHLIKKEQTGLSQVEWVEKEKPTSKGKQPLIAKLAAKVLDFDLAYVEKRLK